LSFSPKRMMRFAGMPMVLCQISKASIIIGINRYPECVRCHLETVP
jgi:hypothetical protein